jgi:hypothetical protein
VLEICQTLFQLTTEKYLRLQSYFQEKQECLFDTLDSCAIKNALIKQEEYRDSF